MITASNQVYRITYEAFSKFSNTLNRCRTFEEVADCFTLNLKYLFNYHLFRASYSRNGLYVHLESKAGRSVIDIDSKADYLAYELQLIKTGIPTRWTEMEELDLPASFTIAEEEPELWGWNFINEERQIVVSLLASKRKLFSQKDINFLKLVSENLETKLLELCLIKELDEKNRIITKINNQQKEVIKERTRELAEKNKTLLEISVLNAHNVREPLSRILGLINLMDNNDSQELAAEVLPLLQRSSQDLDLALQNVIARATKDLSSLKA